jgi:hypothetical protein
LQQPAHDAPPHWHVPPEHASPLAHAPHVAPAVPHADDDCEAGGTHELPLQQPPEHEVALQTHWPVDMLHASPEAQAPQVAPAAPHEDVDSEVYGSHVPPAVQQPFGQVAALHAHVPVAVLQRPFGQAAHDAPPVPHWLAVCDAATTHVLPLQQPPGHEFASHWHAPALLVHSCPEPHESHAAPLAPHDVRLWDAYGTHVFPLQQPFGQEVASQTHAPLALQS